MFVTRTVSDEGFTDTGGVVTSAEVFDVAELGDRAIGSSLCDCLLKMQPRSPEQWPLAGSGSCWFRETTNERGMPDLGAWITRRDHHCAGAGSDLAVTSPLLAGRGGPVWRVIAPRYGLGDTPGLSSLAADSRRGSTTTLFGAIPNTFLGSTRSGRCRDTRRGVCRAA